jgi:aldehyde dehydrogenase (NAD+)
MAGEGRRLTGETVPSELPDKWAMSVREPLGVVGLITPWNFPIAIPCWKLMPALVAGNTVVLKPSSATPHCAVLLVELLEAAGLPAGVVNLVTGSGEAVGMPLVRHPDVAVLGFTGNGETGRRIAIEAADRGARLAMELGGKNAIIVLDDADLELAVEGILWSAFGTSGQRCTACSRVIVTPGVADDLVARLAERADALRLGSGLDAATDVGPLVDAAAVEKVARYTALAIEDGAELVSGGRRARDGILAAGHYFEPTIVDRVVPQARVAQEEVFGPLLSIIRVADTDAAIEVANSVRYGLSSSIYTSDTSTAFRAMRALDSGIVYVNAGTIGAETHLPFGGTKATGNGHREAGHAALNTYTEWKTIYVDYSGRLQRAQIDNQPAG